MIINLSQEYPSIYKLPVISRVDTAIFTERYFTYCLKCGFCRDNCCSVGTDIDLENLERIDEWVGKLENYIGVNRSEWFEAGHRPYPEYPSKAFVRTKTVNGSCIFLNRLVRGCLLHSICLGEGIDYHYLKPMLCSIFPITFDNGLLHPAVEVDDRSLVCLGEGETLYMGVRSELAYYFGSKFIDEIDALQVA